MDAWFAGFQPNLAAVVWIGYDNPRKLGDSARETGGGLALPVWIEFMQHALAKLPVQTSVVPDGVVQRGSDWIFEEFASGGGVSSVGLDDKIPQPPFGRRAQEHLGSLPLSAPISAFIQARAGLINQAPAGA